MTSEANLLQVVVPRPESLRRLQSSKVPSSRIGRLFHYGGTNHNHLPTRSFGLMFQHLRPRGVPRLRRCFRIAPPLDNIHRVHRVLILPDDDRGEFDAHRVQTHADAWRSVESRAVPQYPRSIRSNSHTTL